MKKINLHFFSISIIIISIISSVLINSLYPPILEKLFLKHGNFEIIQIEKEDAHKFSIGLCKYLSGINKNINVKIAENNIEDLMSNKELNHLSDVRKIYIAIEIIDVLLLIYYFIHLILCKQMHTYTIFKTLLFCISLIFIICIACIVNFDKVFILFHKILFSNNDWLLTPGKDIIISLMPLSFFINISIKILISFLIILSILLIFCYTIQLLKKK